MKTLYVHIGTMKTGTTAIQEFCWYNNELLQKKGYCYPDLYEFSTEVTRRRNGRFLVKEFGTEEEKQQSFCGGMKRIAELFMTYDNIVLSDEGIWGATYKRRTSLWEELKREGEKHNYQVKIIVYLRRQDEYAVSCWKQMVKMGTVEGSWSWDKYVDQIPKGRQLDYYEKLESVADVLGKDNIIVRVYDWDAFEGGSIYSDFLKIIGLSMTEDYVVTEEKVNLSLEGNMHEIRRVINTIGDMEEEDSRFFREILVKCSQEQDVKKNYSMFSREENESFLQKYEDGNRMVAEKYLGKENVSLFNNKIKDIPKWTKDNPEMSEDIIRFVAVGFSCLMEENKKLQEENKKLWEETKKLREEDKKTNQKIKNLKENLLHPTRAIYRRIRGVE